MTHAAPVTDPDSDVITGFAGAAGRVEGVVRVLDNPAVVNCGEATTRLKTGDRVRVDGGRGIVEILEKA